MRTHQSVRQNPRATALEVSLITEHFGYAPARRQNGKVSAHPAKRKSTSSVLHRHVERRVQFAGTPLVLPRLADLWTNGTRPPDRRTLLARLGAQEFDPGAIVNQHGVHHRTGLLGRYTPDLAQAHKLQAEFKLVPLSSFNKPFTPPAGQTGGPYAPKEIVRNVIGKMTASEYFNFMADAMKVSPRVSRRLTGCPLRTMTSYYACGCIGPRRLHPRYCRRRIHHGHLRQ